MRRLPSDCLLLLPVAPSVSCSCLDARLTRSSKLPPSPAVSRCLPVPTTRLSSLPAPPSLAYAVGFIASGDCLLTAGKRSGSTWQASYAYVEHPTPATRYPPPTYHPTNHPQPTTRHPTSNQPTTYRQPTNQPTNQPLINRIPPCPFTGTGRSRCRSSSSCRSSGASSSASRASALRTSGGRTSATRPSMAPRCWSRCSVPCTRSTPPSPRPSATRCSGTRFLSSRRASVSGGMS